ncbi:hypothetical protein [Streptomyces sp. NPDC101132]|uniref:hypothetical protein n=1 Tax=Streptomyces sp. NPDC101132 TaxID=3366110 RepID=UPI0037F1717B
MNLRDRACGASESEVDQPAAALLRHVPAAGGAQGGWTLLIMEESFDEPPWSHETE